MKSHTHSAEIMCNTYNHRCVRSDTVRIGQFGSIHTTYIRNILNLVLKNHLKVVNVQFDCKEKQSGQKRAALSKYEDFGIAQMQVFIYLIVHVKCVLFDFRFGIIN